MRGILLLFPLLMFFSLHVYASEIHSFDGGTQGTSYRISYTGSQQSRLQDQVETALLSFDLIFSNYRPDSEIERLNARVTDVWQAISPDLYQLLVEAQRISQATQGAFDVTIGQQLKSWGFGPYRRGSPHIPTEAEIVASLKNSGYRHLQLRASPPSLRKLRPRLLIDVSGIAQGLAVDRLALLLERSGISSYLIEIGGEVLARGAKPDQSPWTVGLERPDQAIEPGFQAILLRDAALSSSGNTQDFFEKDGRRYSHVFDPRVGRPVQSRLASIHVVAERTVLADAYAKAFMILDDKALQELAHRRSLSVLVMEHDGKTIQSQTYGDNRVFGGESEK